MIPMWTYFSTLKKGRFGLFELMDVQERTASILARKADIMILDSLHKTLRQGIEAAAVQVF
jgi:predicted nucleotidyltransferase